jgi:hypothetical protein
MYKAQELKDGTYFPGDGELVNVEDYQVSGINKGIACEGKLFQRGYWVSLGGYETIVSSPAAHSELLLDIADAYRLLALRESCYVGIWHEGDKVYFDLSEYIGTRTQAIQLGKARNQLAIWDIAAGEAISLKEVPFIAQVGPYTGISGISQASANDLAQGRRLRNDINGY